MIRALTCLLILGFGSTAWGGVVYFEPITGDVDSGISTSNDYTLAIDFGDGAPVTVNGVPFTQVTGSVNEPAGFDYQFNSGTYNTHGGNGNYALTGAVAGLFQDMIYNGGCVPGGIASITLSDLTPGQTYKTRIYTRQWDFGTWGAGASKRLSDVTFDGDGSPLTLALFEDDMTMLGQATPGTAAAVNYVFTADASGTATIQFTQAVNNASWHVYGLTNERVSASALTGAPTMSPAIANSSFEAESFGIFPGYTSGNRAITGWYTNAPTRVGLNPANGSPFANNGTIPDGSQVAFLQNGDATIKTTLSQPLYGFRPDEKYIVSFRENYRAGYTVPNLQLTLGQQTIVASHGLNLGNGYRYIASDVFSADGTQEMLTFTNTTAGAGDATAVIDQVEIARVYKHFGDNFNVNANVNPLDANPANDAADRFSGLLISGNTWTPDYLEAGAGDNLQQLGHPSRPGALFFATKSVAGSTNSYVSPNHNFVDGVVPGEKTQYVLQFKTEPLAQLDNGSPVTSGLDDWTCVNFGVTSDRVNQGPNVYNGVGVLFRRNGGWQIFDGTADGALVADSLVPLTTDAEGYYDVRIAYEVDEFSVAAPVDVAVFVGEQLLYSFTTAGGFTQNYFTFGAYAPTSGSNYTYSYFDDVELWSTAVPEPSSAVLVLLGLGVLVGARRFRR